MTHPPVTRTDLVRYAGVVLLLVVGGIHLQQFEGPLRPVPTIGPLFVLNAVGAAALALVLAGVRGDLARLTALAGIAMTLGALAALAITRVTVLFGYSEPTLRPAVTLAAVVEVVTVAALGTLVLMDDGMQGATGASGPGRRPKWRRHAAQRPHP
jgi:hypothetical protein